MLIRNLLKYLSISGEDKIYCFKSRDGNIVEYRNNFGEYHNIDDKPAIISSNGTQYWYKNNKLHRDNNLPAIITSDGHQKWYQNGIKIK